MDASTYGILPHMIRHLTVFSDARQQIFEGGATVPEMQQHFNLTDQSASLLPAYRNSPDISKLASYFGNAYEGINYIAQERQKPCLYIAHDWDDEIDRLADVLRERRLLNHKCGIIVPRNRGLFGVTNRLRERGIEVHQAIAVRRGGSPPDFDSLSRAATAARSKEFTVLRRPLPATHHPPFGRGLPSLGPSPRPCACPLQILRLPHRRPDTFFTPFISTA